MPRAHLPPIGVILVYNLEQVPSVEAKACFLAGDEAVSGRVIIEVAFNKYLSPRDLGRVKGMNGERIHPLAWQTVQPSLPLSLCGGEMPPGLPTLPSWYFSWQTGVKRLRFSS